MSDKLTDRNKEIDQALQEIHDAQNGKNGTIDNHKKHTHTFEIKHSHEKKYEDEENWWSVTEAMTISSAVLIFFLLVLSFATYLIRIGRNSEVILKFFGTTLIICVATFLIVAGYSDKQIAPVIGLLGTIAGYLLGRNSNKDEG